MKKEHMLLWKLKDTKNLNGKQNLSKVRANSDSVGKQLANATIVNSLNASLILLHNYWIEVTFSSPEDNYLWALRQSFRASSNSGVYACVEELEKP